MWIAAGILVPLFLITAIVRSCNGEPAPVRNENVAPQVQAPQPTRDLAAEKKRLTDCENKMRRIDGMVSDMDIGRSSVKVYVTPKFLNRTTIQEKSAFFEITQCIAMKGEDKMIPMQIMDARTGKRVGIWDGRKVSMD